MWRECAADMEGGAPEEDLSDVLPPFGPQHANSHHAEGDDGDDSLFWDYVGPKAGPGSSNSSNAAAPPPAPAPSSAPWSSIMATAKSAMAGAPSAAQVAALGGGIAPTPRSAPKQAGGWASAVGAGTSNSAAARPAAPSSSAAARPAATPSASSSSMQQHAAAGQRGGAAGGAPAVAPQSALSAQSGPPLMAGDVVLSSEFQGWCRNEMLRFFGHTDLSLVEVLVTLPSRSEVADYCSMFMEGKPGVSTFVAEFLKRKDAEVARATAPAKKGSKAKKAAGPPPPTTAASVLQGKAQPAAAPAPAAAPSGNGVRSSEWSQVPVAPPKAKGGAAAGQQKSSKGGAAQNTKKSGFNVLKAA
uniref:GYF domain-containing protein n=2 Tax=Dunaliella tertiolecta TaxID=3047 RepID=A0A7S3VRX4_DUNTE